MKKILIFSLIAAFIASLAAAAVDASRSQRELAQGLIRLHIRAASNSEEDQSVKLRVRDALLEGVLSEISAANVDEALAQLTAGLDSIRSTAEAVSGTECAAYICEEPFPERDYGGCVLPAGVYKALRVDIGPALGANWWCIVFPPLCTSLSLEPETVFSEEQSRFVADRDADVKIKFKLLEWLGFIRKLFA